MTASAVTIVPACASPTDEPMSALDMPGADILVTDTNARETYLRDATGKWPSHVLSVGRPRSSEEVAAIVRHATANDLAVVPQGGNTGLVGGCGIGAERPAVMLSLDRMRAIRRIDPVGATVVVEAGCILADLQAAVAEQGFAIPLGLGSEGSATIGGLISTNAGGIRALRYGVMRSLVLGLEVVLPDGRVWDGLRTVAKNNMGYDLKQLFIGGEGTLGVVTAAALRLVPAWTQTETAWLAVESPAAALSLLDALRAALGDVVVACELIQRRGIEWGEVAVPGLKVPGVGDHGWFVLIEFASAATLLPIREALETALGNAIEQGLVLDGTLAESEAQRREFWKIREAVVMGKIAAKPSVTLDVAVPLGQVPAFLDEAGVLAEALMPGVECLGFGHVGDGNIHFSVHRGSNAVAAFEPRVAEICAALEQLALTHGGSICAEHGVGRRMRDAVAAAVGDVEHDLFRRVKRAIDPENRMNPGAVVEI